MDLVRYLLLFFFRKTSTYYVLVRLACTSIWFDDSSEIVGGDVCSKIVVDCEPKPFSSSIDRRLISKKFTVKVTTYSYYHASIKINYAIFSMDG